MGDPVETLKLSLPVLPQLRALGYAAALVAQDGLEHLTVPWGEFDVLFIGGTTAWKLGPGPVKLIRTARKLGRYIHMGRVNSFQRFVYAQTPRLPQRRRHVRRLRAGREHRPRRAVDRGRGMKTCELRVTELPHVCDRCGVLQTPQLMRANFTDAVLMSWTCLPCATVDCLRAAQGGEMKRTALLALLLAFGCGPRYPQSPPGWHDNAPASPPPVADEHEPLLWPDGTLNCRAVASNAHDIAVARDRGSRNRRLTPSLTRRSARGRPRASPARSAPWRSTRVT